LFDPVTLALILAGGIVVIGFLGDYLFHRTGVPDMLFLIVLGMLIGPVTRLVDATSATSFAPYLAALALVFILFDGGMTLNIYRVFSESPRAAVLAVVGFVLSAAVTSVLMALFVIPTLPPIYAVLFGTILGGSSSMIVISLASKVRVSGRSSTILSLESAINDVLCIVFSLIIIEIATLGMTVDLPTIARSVAGRFSIGAMVGIVTGLSWLSVLKRIVKTNYSYILTLAVVLLAYAFSEFLGGSGVLCSLLFGIMLGNEKEIYGILRMKKSTVQVVDEGLKRFESEIAFLLRTFFFVYIGLIATMPSLPYVFFGIALSFTLLLIRIGAVRVATMRSDLVEERPIMSVLLTRGLAAAVLVALIPVQYADPVKYPVAGEIFRQLSPIYINIAIVVILTTAAIATIGIPLLRRQTKKNSKLKPKSD
jgi:cell volume regulation protein A